MASALGAASPACVAGPPSPVGIPVPFPATVVNVPLVKYLKTFGPHTKLHVGGLALPTASPKTYRFPGPSMAMGEETNSRLDEPGKVLMTPSVTFRRLNVSIR